MNLSTNSIEWALKHVTRFYSSDFFPDPFEFEAISTQWQNLRPAIQGWDLAVYTPKAPLQALAPKPNGTFRIVHQLDPLDAIVYTALAHTLAEDIEAARIPQKEGIACSYRIAPDVNGSFFAGTVDGWDLFTNRTKHLIDQYPKGFVLLCDIVDYYNQIYSHRVANIIGELGRPDAKELGKVVERFIEAMNTQTSRGIPVGPAASIVFAEAVMIDLDRKVLATTRDYVRWVDDFRIFFRTYADAQQFLHQFTEYIHDNHRLVLSGEKTRIIPVEKYKASHEQNDAEREERLLAAKTQALALDEYYHELIGNAGPYNEPEDEFDEQQFEALLREFRTNKKFEIASEAYKDLLNEEMRRPHPDFLLIRRVLRKAKSYRIRSILPFVLVHFERLLPLAREVCLYLAKALNQEAATKNATLLLKIADSPSMQLPYVNMWLAWLFSSSAFADNCFAPLLGKASHLRGQALIAIRARDLAWVKSRKNGLDTLGPYEKRAVLYSSQILSEDERKVWLGIAKERGDLLEKTLADHLLSGLQAAKLTRVRSPNPPPAASPSKSATISATKS
jgi:hypothetical protein